MMFECLFRGMLWCGQLVVFREECDFWNHMFYKLINYDDEELCWWIFTCNWRRIDGVWMYWNMWMLIVEDLLLNICIDWVIFSWFHDVGVGLYIHIGDDKILYPYSRWRILCIHIGDDYDTDVSKVTTLRWPVPHAYRSRV